MRRKTEKLFKSPFLKSIGFIGLALFAAAFLTAAKPATNQDTDVETCTACHEEMAATLTDSPHSPVQNCSDCHGDGELHTDEGGGFNIFAYKAEEMASEKSQKCIICHTKDNSRYLSSDHGKAAMDCTSCHSIHTNSKPSLLNEGPTKGCLECHEDVFSQFQLNERHRLQEGILECTSCHNPHEPAARTRLGGFKHQACLQCHTDKGGPFLFEHEASRVEGCTACHEVHGTPNRHLLTHQSTSDLCFSCHTSAVSWHSRFTSTSTNCAVCHSALHGSNLSKIFLK